MRPASLSSTASHAACAQLTLLHQCMSRAAELSSPCRSPTPRALASPPNACSRIALRGLRTTEFLPPRATNNTTNEGGKKPADFRHLRESSPP
eukprot:5022565-Pleurochrysis_carterae.AAC.1